MRKENGCLTALFLMMAVVIGSILSFEKGSEKRVRDEESRQRTDTIARNDSIVVIKIK